MPEDVNVKIIRRIANSAYDEKIKKLLIKLIREEFKNSDLSRWAYSEFYDKSIRECCQGVEEDGD